MWIQWNCIISQDLIQIPAYVALIVILFNLKSFCTTMKYVIRPKVWKQAPQPLYAMGTLSFPATAEVTLSSAKWDLLKQSVVLLWRDKFELGINMHYPHLSSANPTWLHAFRTNSRQEATGKLSSSLYPMPSSVRLAAELFISCSSSVQGKHIFVPCGREAMKWRHCVANYTP